MRIFLSEKKDAKIITVSGDEFRKFVNSTPSLKKELSLPYYQTGILYAKGGVAREALMAYIMYRNGQSFAITVRDRDFVLFYNGLDYEKMEDIETKYYNLDIDNSYDIKSYMKSRDFTFNQVIINSDQLIFTKDAYDSIRRKYVNPSQKENDNQYSKVSGRIFARLIYFSIRYGYDISDNIIYNSIDEKNLLVCLLKSYELGIEDQYYRQSYYFDLIPDDIENSDEMLIYLMLKNPYININEPIDKLLKSVKNKNIYSFLSGDDSDVINNFRDDFEDIEKDNINKYMKYLD
jgi:hypothetical protein